MCKHCWLSTLHETLPSLISRRTLTCGSCIPLSKIGQVLGWEADPIPSWARAGLDWFRNGHMAKCMVVRFKARFVRRFRGSFSFLCWRSSQNQFCISLFPQMWVVGGMAEVFRALHHLGRESSKKNPRNQSWDFNYLNPKVCLSSGPPPEQSRNYLSWFVFDFLTCSLGHPNQ